MIGAEMNRADFLKLIGSQQGTSDYIPVAMLLKNGYGVAGYFNTPVNEDFSSTCVLVNARLIDLSHSVSERRAIHNFGDFLQEISTRLLQQDDVAEEAELDANGLLGKSVPLSAVSFEEIAVVYPVSRISALMRKVEEDQHRIPTFLDFDNRSVIVKLLKTKIW
jgi:hypothetical protein